MRSSLFFKDNGYYKDILVASILFAAGTTASIAVTLVLQGNTTTPIACSGYSIVYHLNHFSPFLTTL